MQANIDGLSPEAVNPVFESTTEGVEGNRPPQARKKPSLKAGRTSLALNARLTARFNHVGRPKPIEPCIEGALDEVNVII